MFTIVFFDSDGEFFDPPPEFGDLLDEFDVVLHDAHVVLFVNLHFLFESLLETVH